MLVLADPASGLTPFEAYTKSGCGYQSFLWQATETTILVIGIYLRTGETFQSEVNSDILANLLALLTNTTHPYVIIGDWQNQPHTLASTVLPAKFKFGILAPDHSVLSGNTIDYAILHNTLAGTTSITPEWAVAWRPHALLKLQFDIEAATKLYRQMPYYPPLPKVPDIDFRPWTTYQTQAHVVELRQPTQWSLSGMGRLALQNRAVPSSRTSLGGPRTRVSPRGGHQAFDATPQRAHLA